MVYKVYVSGKARQDLEDIFLYIANNLHSPVNARKKLLRIRKAISSLNVFPRRYKIYNREPWKTYEIRMMPFENYCIFYEVEEDKAEVRVDDVFYSKKDFSK